MSAMFDNPNKTYIKSNAGTIMHLLWFVCGLLLLLVTGLCAFVVFGRDDTSNYHFDTAGQFYYQLTDDKATLVAFTNQDAESFTIPATVNYGGKDYAVTVIDNHAFSNNNHLTEVVIPDSVAEIKGDSVKQTGAFSGCVALKKVRLANGLARIGAYAFKNCLALTTIDFPSSVQYVDAGAFMGCFNLQAITLNSNSILGEHCFDDCIKVDTLILSNEVSLDNDKRQVLAALPKLSNFVTNGNANYTVMNNCLITRTNTANDTVVLGGYRAPVPDNIKCIADWAWGKRAAGLIYVPSTVTDIGANSFDKNALKSIYTDAAEKPQTWSIAVPVYTGARAITFDANIDGIAPVTSYVYQNGAIEIEPTYAELFHDVKNGNPFKQWNRVGNTYIAQYYEDVATPTDLDELEDALDTAEVFKNDEDKRLKFTLDFWEAFKTLYGQGKYLQSQSTPNQYLVQDLTAQLVAVNQQINDATDTEILESTDWTVGLKNLLNAIDQLDSDDLSNPEQYAALATSISEADILLKNSAGINADTAQYRWKELRKLYEKLLVDCSENGLLQREIKTCQNLNRADYNADDWQKMQQALQTAEQIIEYNLTDNLRVTTIRKNLLVARNNLCEVTWSDAVTKLNAWVSVCHDLLEKDYEKNGYDRLRIELLTIVNKKLDNNSAVNAEITNLQNRYQNLVPANDYSAYQNHNTGILNKKSIPFFITAVLLFTGAVAAGAKAASLKKQLRQTQE